MVVLQVMVVEMLVYEVVMALMAVNVEVVVVITVVAVGGDSGH